MTLSEWRARVHPQDLGRVEGIHDQAVSEKRREYSVEYRIVRSAGDLRWVERRCSISYDADARPQRVVGVSIDITERKQAEKQRDTLNAELDHRVKNVLATVGAPSSSKHRMPMRRLMTSWHRSIAASSRWQASTSC